jgi:16S rRNA (cytosine967-C5)-methyltransferase
MKISPARTAAFDILLRVETTDAYASELLHSSHLAKLSPADHGLATEIVMGVLRWRSVLDGNIASHIDKPLAKLDGEVLTSIRIGAYQLLFLDRIPAHAAINESVELVKKARKRSAAGMVNAVLRKIKPVATPKREHSDTRPLESARNDSAFTVHPEWLVNKWSQNYGVETAKAICEYDQHAPSTVIRADAALAQELAAEGVHLEDGRLLTNAYRVKSGEVTRSPAFRERRLVIQDEGSQLIALLVGHGERILDCCAAPGGKTRILAEQNPKAAVVAMDLHPHRAALLRRLVSAPNVSVLAADARNMPFATQFDRILVDTPCTGTGTLARNPDIKWRLKREDITRLQIYQIEILSAAMNQLLPSGRLLYSTCSLENEENEEVIEQVMPGRRDFRVIDIHTQLTQLQREGELAWPDVDSLVRGPYLRTIPGVHPCDGFFAALLEREL